MIAKTNLMTRKVVKPDNDNEHNSDHSKQFNIILGRLYNARYK